MLQKELQKDHRQVLAASTNVSDTDGTFEMVEAFTGSYCYSADDVTTAAYQTFNLVSSRKECEDLCAADVNCNYLGWYDSKFRLGSQCQRCVLYRSCEDRRPSACADRFGPSIWRKVAQNTARVLPGRAYKVEPQLTGRYCEKNELLAVEEDLSLEGCQHICGQISNCRFFSYYPRGGPLEDATEEACSASCRIFSGCKRPSRTQCQTPPVMIYSASTTTTTATATQTTTATIATTTTTNNTTTTLTTTITTSTTSTTTATTAATTTATLTITTTIPPRVVLSVEAGEQFSCRIKASDSTVYCWGREGLRTQPPLRVAFFHISLGSKFGCGLRLSDRKPQCWGENPPSVPAAAPALTTISSGGAQHACGITDNQTVFCWGNTAPIPANAVDMQFAFIAASRDPDSNAVCGIPVDEDVPVQCWGSPRPTVPNSTSFSSIGLGRGFWCAINKNTRKVECSGNQDVSSDLQQPVLRDFEDPISVHVNSACALRVIAGITGSQLGPRCWGYVDRFIPNDSSGNPNRKAMPYDWEDLGYRNLTSVSVGFRHACGRRDDDEVVCWGDEFFGETDPP